MPQPTRLFAWSDSKDITSSQSVSIYTVTSKIEVGTAIYDNTGTATGQVITSFNQDGSFNIG